MDRVKALDQPPPPPQSPLYLAYGDAGFQWALFGPALAYSLIAALGIPMNLAVCYVTMRRRKLCRTLGSSTGILLGLNSLAEVVHQSSHFLFLAVTATGTNFLPLRLAFSIQWLSLFAFFCAINMLPSLAADRFLAVAFPIFYQRLNQRLYLLAHLAFICLYCLVAFFNIFDASRAHPDWPVTGFVSDLFAVPGLSKAGHFMGLAALGSTVLLYTLVAVLMTLKKGTSNGNNEKRLQKVYRSLALIVSLNVGGYLVANTQAVLFRTVLKVAPLHIWFLSHFTGIFLNIAGMANGPILYFNSKDYRNACQKEWHLLVRFVSKWTGNNSISVVGIGHGSNNQQNREAQAAPPLFDRVAAGATISRSL